MVWVWHPRKTDDITQATLSSQLKSHGQECHRQTRLSVYIYVVTPPLCSEGYNTQPVCPTKHTGLQRCCNFSSFCVYLGLFFLHSRDATIPRAVQEWSRKEYTEKAGDAGQWLRPLLNKHKDLSLDPQFPGKKHGICNPRARGMETS